MIELNNVSFLRGKRVILDQLDWTTEQGQQWIVLGRNGSGKTTLLEILMGYQFPSKGTVRVLGHQYGRCDVRELRKEMGYIGQALMEKFTLRDPVWEIVVTGIQAHLRLYEKIPPEWKERAYELLRIVRLEHLAEQSLSVCSQGERKKIMLARALMSDPKLLILDEPCSGLDLYEREKWLLDLEQLRDRHIHTVYVTHHLEEIIPLFTHVALLEGGKFVAAGPKEEVLTEQHLSSTYGLPVAVDWLDNRPWVRLKSTGWRNNNLTEQVTKMNNDEVQLPIHYEIGSHWIITANHGYIPYAQEELRRRYAQLKSQILIPGEVALMELPEEETNIWRHQYDQAAIFIRDLFPVHIVVNADAIQNEQQASWLWNRLCERSGHTIAEGTKVSIHFRKSKGKEETDVPSLKPLLEEGLKQSGLELVLQSPEWIWSVFLHEGNLYAGIATLKDQGSDWPGGAIRFQREEGQISRAKFKLLEAERVFGLDFSTYKQALDIGAAPGGWTSLLLERGVYVTAVDPAKMHESLQDHPQLSIIQRNAGEVAFEPDEFDLLVCDMSWSPKHTAQLVIQLLEAVRTGGTVIVTVKLMHKKPLQTIRDCMDMFEQHLHILRAKQLFHNRDEITLYMMKY